MKIYTRTGDKGKTSLIGGRTDKFDARVEAYGTLDEVNSFLGFAITQISQENEGVLQDLIFLQHKLFECGSDIADVRKKPNHVINSLDVENLEKQIDKYSRQLPHLTCFILPSGTRASASLQVCRTIVRRAERLLVKAYSNELQDFPKNENLLPFLNRLSDFLYVLARYMNYIQGVEEVKYE